MVTSEAFQAAFNAGNFAQALKLALAEAVELQITTTVVQSQSDGTASGSIAGDRLYTRLNIVDSELENEIGSGFLNQEPYTHLLAFHLSQANQAPQLLHQNLHLLAQLSEVLSTLEIASELDLVEVEEASPISPPAAPAELLDLVLEGNLPEIQVPTSSQVSASSQIPAPLDDDLWLDEVVLVEPLPELDVAELQPEPSLERFPDFDLVASEPALEDLALDSDADEVSDADIPVLLEESESAQDLVADIVSTLHLDTPELTDEDDRQLIDDGFSTESSPPVEESLESSLLEGSALDDAIDDDLAAILSLDTSDDSTDESDLTPPELELDSSLVLADETESVEELADDLMAALSLETADAFPEPSEAPEESDISILESLDAELNAELVDPFEPSSFDSDDVDLPADSVDESLEDVSLEDSFLESGTSALDIPELATPELGYPEPDRLSESNARDDLFQDTVQPIEPTRDHDPFDDVFEARESASGSDPFDDVFASTESSGDNLFQDVFESTEPTSGSDPFQGVFESTEPTSGSDPFQSVFESTEPDSFELADSFEPVDTPEPANTAAIDLPSDELADADLNDLLAGAEEPETGSPEELQDALDAWLNLEIDDSSEPTAAELTMPSLQPPVLADDPFQAPDVPYVPPTVASSPLASPTQDSPDDVSALDQTLSGYEAVAQKTVDELFDEAFGETDSADAADDMFVAFFDTTADPALDEVNPFGNFSLETLETDTPGDRPADPDPLEDLVDFTAEFESQADSNGTEADVPGEPWPNLPPPPPHSNP